MSADNGFILRRNKDNQFVLQMYWASSDEGYPPIDADSATIRPTLESAIQAYEDIQDMPNMIIEYGLTVHVKEVTLA